MLSEEAPLEKELTETQAIKKKIVDAASTLFEKKGLYDTSVAEVAEEAGISVPVTYHYVTRKSDIMLLIMEDFTDQFKGRVLPQIETMSDPVAKLKKAMEVFFSLVNENLVKVVLVYRESRTLGKEGRAKIMAAELAHQQVFMEILAEGVEAGIFSVPDMDLAAYNIIAAGHTWALKNWHFRERFTWDKFFQQQYQFVLQAITAK